MNFNKFIKISIGLWVVFLLLISHFLFLISPIVVLAEEANVNGVDGTQSTNCIKTYPWSCITSFTGLVSKFYNIALAAVGVAALGAIVYGGILYTVSAGNSSKQSEARSWIGGAIAGLVLLLGASLILKTIGVGVSETGQLTEPGLPPLPATPSPKEEGLTEIEKAERIIERSNDTETKNYLSKISSGLISFNKRYECAASFDKECTSMAKLPENGVDGLRRIVGKAIGQKDKGCDCAIMVTGGTEKSGHVEHGPGKSVIDLRYKGGAAGPNIDLKEYLEKQVGTTLKIGDRKTTQDGKMNIYFEKNADNTEHFHITFN